MGQPDTVNQLLDPAPPLSPKLYVVDKLLVEPYKHPLFWISLHTNDVKGITFNIFWNKMSYSKILVHIPLEIFIAHLGRAL